MCDVILEVFNLSKTFAEGDRQRRVFSNLNASIRKGEFVVLLGRSGSGKSTLLNLISGIDLPSGGEVWIGGRNLTGIAIFTDGRLLFVPEAFNDLARGETMTVGVTYEIADDQGRYSSFK